MPRPAVNRAALLMMASTVCFTVMFGFVKTARAELGAFEVMVWRGVVAVPLSWWLVRRGGGTVAVQQRGLLALRTLLGFGAMGCFFASAVGLGLSDITFIHKLQPIVLALLAPVFLGRSERAGGRVWVVLAAGLLGCALLLAPRPPSDLQWGLVALAGAAFSAGAHITVRKLGATEAPAVIVLWFQLGMTIIAFTAHGVSAGDAMGLPPGDLVPALLGCGLAAAGGQLLLTRAYQMDRAAKVAAASYVSPVWALVGDLLVFAIVPSPLALVGGAIIVAAGLYLLAAPNPTQTDDDAGEDAEPIRT